MKYLIAFLVIAMSSVVIASDDTTVLCVAYLSGTDVESPDDWKKSKIFAGDLHACIGMASNLDDLVGLQLEDGYTLKDTDRVNIWCDTSDEPSRQCL